MASRDGYERSDLSFWAAVSFAGFIVVLLGATALITGGLDRWLQGINQGTAALSPVARLDRQPPEPRLQVNEAEDMAEFRKTENARLNSYGWVDAPAGVVHIPIERAMDLTAQDLQ